MASFRPMLRETARRGGHAIGALLLIGCTATARIPERGPNTAQSSRHREAEPEKTPDSAPVHRASDSVDSAKAFHEKDQIDDGFDEEPRVTQGEKGPARPHPLSSLDETEIERRVVNDVASLGSMSIGRPSGGKLFNGVQMPESPYWTVVNPSGAWGTAETVRDLAAAIKKVNERFPNTQKLSIGHISSKDGGHLNPHLSHQNGRDVDVSYYYRDDARWYKRAHAQNLDLPRTWTFVRTLIVDSDVELILIDHSIQQLLRKHAESVGENRQWLDSIFKGRAGEPSIIRHAKGHTTHLHVRFYSPVAQETARRCVPALVKHNVIEAPPRYLQHVAKKGDTLAKLAKRYGTTIKEIQRVNGLKSTRIQAKRRYLIPQSGTRLEPTPPVTVPPRRLPPGPDGSIRPGA